MSGDRIEAFVDKLRSARSAKAAAAVVRGELSHIWGRGADRKADTTVKRTISRYREAVKAALGDHAALRYLHLKPAVQKALKAAETARIVAGAGDRRPIVVDWHIRTATHILHNAEYCPPFELAGALIAVTGRRPLEVLQDLTLEGDFRPVEAGDADPTLFDTSVAPADRYSLLFAGQRKNQKLRDRGADRGVYEIPVLAHPELVLFAIGELRRRRSFAGKSADEVGNSAWAPIGKYVRGDYPTQSSPGFHDKNGDPLSPKNLRAAYATCAWQLYAPRKVSLNAYFARILGHGELDLVTSFSYDVFYPAGDAREYNAAAHDAAIATLRELERALKREGDDRQRAYLQTKIAGVKDRLKEA